MLLPRVGTTLSSGAVRLLRLYTFCALEALPRKNSVGTVYKLSRRSARLGMVLISAPCEAA